MTAVSNHNRETSVPLVFDTRFFLIVLSAQFMRVSLKLCHRRQVKLKNMLFALAAAINPGDIRNTIKGTSWQSTLYFQIVPYTVASKFPTMSLACSWSKPLINVRAILCSSKASWESYDGKKDKWKFTPETTKLAVELKTLPYHRAALCTIPEVTSQSIACKSFIHRGHQYGSIALCATILHKKLSLNRKV